MTAMLQPEEADSRPDPVLEVVPESEKPRGRTRIARTETLPPAEGHNPRVGGLAKGATNLMRKHPRLRTLYGAHVGIAVDEAVRWNV